MESRMRNNFGNTTLDRGRPLGEDYKFQRSYSDLAKGKVQLKPCYFSIGSLLLLVCLTASLLILPLVLPPLPPPPFMLLLLPIGILSLMILAFMPSNVGDVTHTYM